MSAAQRLAVILASVSAGLCLVVALYTAVEGMADYAVESRRPAAALLVFLPVAVGLLGVHAAARGSAARLWLAAGLLCGFSIVLGFSVGRSFAPAAVLMVAAASAASVARATWWLLTIPLWVAAGITAITFLLLIAGNDFPINAFGSWLFAGAAVALAACYGGRYLWIHHGANRWWLPALLTVTLLLILLISTRARDTWQYVSQGHW